MVKTWIPYILGKLFLQYIIYPHALIETYLLLIIMSVSIKTMSVNFDYSKADVTDVVAVVAVAVAGAAATDDDDDDRCEPIFLVLLYTKTTVSCRPVVVKWRNLRSSLEMHGCAKGGGVH